MEDDSTTAQLLSRQMKICVRFDTAAIIFGPRQSASGPYFSVPHARKQPPNHTGGGKSRDYIVSIQPPSSSPPGFTYLGLSRQGWPAARRSRNTLFRRPSSCQSLPWLLLSRRLEKVVGRFSSWSFYNPFSFSSASPPPRPFSFAWGSNVALFSVSGLCGASPLPPPTWLFLSLSTKKVLEGQ